MNKLTVVMDIMYRVAFVLVLCGFYMIGKALLYYDISWLYTVSYNTAVGGFFIFILAGIYTGLIMLHQRWFVEESL